MQSFLRLHVLAFFLLRSVKGFNVAVSHSTERYFRRYQNSAKNGYPQRLEGNSFFGFNLQVKLENLHSENSVLR